MLDLNNSCTTLMEYNMAQKIYYSKHNSQYLVIHSQHNTTDKEHNTTQNISRAECTSSSADGQDHYGHACVVYFKHSNVLLTSY